MEYASEVMYLDGFTYEEVENSKNKENELIEVASEILKNKHGYFSLKIGSFSEL